MTQRVPSRGELVLSANDDHRQRGPRVGAVVPRSPRGAALRPGLLPRSWKDLRHHRAGREIRNAQARPRRARGVARGGARGVLLVRRRFAQWRHRRALRSREEAAVSRAPRRGLAHRRAERARRLDAEGSGSRPQGASLTALEGVSANCLIDLGPEGGENGGRREERPMARWFFEPGHTAAEFSARHMMVSYVRGHFKDVHGSLNFDPKSPAGSSVEVVIDARKIWTGEPTRDAHLRSADFLDVENFPEISFYGNKV